MTSKIKSLVTVLWIGLLAGTLDITDNLIFNQLRGITPTMVFRYIASGLIGLPLSAVPHPRSAITLASRINGVLALLLFIGLPISLLVRRSLTQAKNGSGALS